MLSQRLLLRSVQAKIMTNQTYYLQKVITAQLRSIHSLPCDMARQNRLYRLRRWTNVKQTSIQRLVSGETICTHINSDGISTLSQH